MKTDAERLSTLESKVRELELRVKVLEDNYTNLIRAITKGFGEVHDKIEEEFRLLRQDLNLPPRPDPDK